MSFVCIQMGGMILFGLFPHNSVKVCIWWYCFNCLPTSSLGKKTKKSEYSAEFYLPNLSLNHPNLEAKHSYSLHSNLVYF